MKDKLKQYDAIIIGAGNGGLIASLVLAIKKQKVLLVEKHNLPGGFATSFVRGRFEFEPSLHELGAVGNQNNIGYVKKLFDELNIKINWQKIPEAFCLVLNINGKIKQYSFPFGINEFSKQLDLYEPGCYKQVLQFLNICKELYECSDYLTNNKGQVHANILKQYFPDYLTTGSYTLQQVLNHFRFSDFVKCVLSAYWPYLGLAPNEIDFCLYANMLSEYLLFGAYIPTFRSNEISSKILDQFLKHDGEVLFNCEATKINIENKHIKSVLTTKGTFETNCIIANIAPNIVYGKLIDEFNVPRYDQKLVNFRKLNRQGFSIYLGLNIDAKSLGLDQYSYFVYSDLDQNKCAHNIKSLTTNNEYIVVVLNNTYKHCSPKKTCIISFTTLYDDAWNNLKIDEYFNLKNELANHFISDFENKMQIDIKSHIEEIEIATPLTFARYTSALNGNIYGYQANKNDGVIVRAANLKNEININGLLFAGGYSFRCHGYSTTYMSGYISGWLAYSYLMELNNE